MDRRGRKGQADLTKTHPQLIGEWDFARNEGLQPEDVSKGCEQQVWWVCSKGHSYKARIFARAAGTQCPYCTGKSVLAGFNDLATTDPDLAGEWYAPLNGQVTPETVSRGSHRKVWWRCREGHVWQAAVYSRTRACAAGCPYCAGKLPSAAELPMTAK